MAPLESTALNDMLEHVELALLETTAKKEALGIHYEHISKECNRLRDLAQSLKSQLSIQSNLKLAGYRELGMGKEDKAKARPKYDAKIEFVSIQKGKPKQAKAEDNAKS